MSDKKRKNTTKIIMITCIALLLFCVGIYGLQRHVPRSNMSHTSIVAPYKLGDIVRENVWASRGYLKRFTKKLFGDDIVNNIHKIRFDPPKSPEFNAMPHLQYYQSNPTGYGMPYRYLPETEVYPNYNVIFTFGNRYPRSFNTLKVAKDHGVDKEDFPNQDVFVIVTHVRPEICVGGEITMQTLKAAPPQPINILPWPQKMEDESKIISDFKNCTGSCCKHPDGWFYMLGVAYRASFRDVLNSKKGNEK